MLPTCMVQEKPAELWFKSASWTPDRAAPRFNPPSLRGVADDPSLRNQLQQLFLSADAERPSKRALKSRQNSCNTANAPQRQPNVAAAVKYLFTMRAQCALSACLTPTSPSRPAAFSKNLLSRVSPGFTEQWMQFNGVSTHYKRYKRYLCAEILLPSLHLLCRFLFYKHIFGMKSANINQTFAVEY